MEDQSLGEEYVRTFFQKNNEIEVRDSLDSLTNPKNKSTQDRDGIKMNNSFEKRVP